MLHCVASYYKRRASPYYWLRYQRPDGTWADKTAKVRIDNNGSLRKIKKSPPSTPVIGEFERFAEIY